ncbi:MAG: hypothetical protein VYB54_11980 [Pseudomonadota bacterium]|nr:hypothetical protein [Pseudomonadota bacterium]
MTDKDSLKPDDDTVPAVPGDSLAAGDEAGGRTDGRGDGAEASGDTRDDMPPDPSDTLASATAVPVTHRDDEEGGDDAATAAPVPAPNRPDWGARLLGLIAIAVAAAVGATTVVPLIGGGAASRISALEQRVDAVASTKPVVRAPDMPDLAPLQARVATLESGLKDMAARPVATGPDPEALAALSGRLDALEQQLAAQDARIDSLPAAAATPAGGADVDLGPLTARVAALESAAGAGASATADEIASKLAAETAAREAADADLRGLLDERLAALRGEVEALSARASAADTKAEAEVARQAALVLALGRLRDQAATSAAFAGAWQSVTRLGVDGAAWPAIAAAAPEGVPTADELRQRFAAAADAAITADNLGESDSVVGGALSRLGNLVRIRRTGDVEGEGVHARVSRAELRLKEGNLSAALKEMQGLSADAAAAPQMKVWVRDAGQRLALDEAVAALQASVFDSMARGG